MASSEHRPIRLEGQTSKRYLYVQRGIFFALVFFLVCAAYLAETIRERQRTLAGVSHYNIVWAASRMSADLNRFGQALAAFAIPGAQVEKSTLRMRADIVRNRVAVMSNGEFLDFTIAVPAQRENMLKITGDLDRIWADLESVGADSVLDKLEDLAAVQTKVAEIVSSARAFSGDQEQQEAFELLRLHIVFSAIVMMLIIFGCAMLFTVTRQYKLIKKSHVKLQEATHTLQQTSVSRLYLDAAINNMSQALCMVDAYERIVIWNAQFIRMFGISPGMLYVAPLFSEALGESSVRPEMQASVNQICDLLGSKSGPRKAVRFAQELSGGQVIEISQQPMDKGWVATFEDITDRRHIEAERMRALADAELARGREQAAEAANRAKSSFLAVMSHEIRTPMNAVLGLASTLLEDKLSDEQRETVAAIHRAGDDLLNLLNDILDYSKLEAGRLTLELSAFSPEAVAAHTISIMEPRASAKLLMLRIAVGPDVPEALIGDAGRIRQVLLNLVSNAVKFTEAGEIVVAVSLGALQDDHAVVEWTVSDSGIGIPCERIGALFTDFVQADSSITRRFGGTGLGLAICKRIVDQMGGQISVTSSIGQGSVFRVSLTLPITDAVTQTENDDEKLYAALKSKIALLGRPLRMLITDDNTTNRLIAARMLKEFDTQIFMACNGGEAVDAASRFPLDMILMDMRMPDMDGLQATHALRARGGKFASIPIIAFTANAFSDDLKACRNAGMNGFLSKPVRKRKLVQAMLDVLPGDTAGSSCGGGLRTGENEVRQLVQDIDEELNSSYCANM